MRASDSKQRTAPVSLMRASYIVLGCLAFLLVWIAGHRGIYFHDQSMVFDGAVRIGAGQTPYRDFIMPFGPGTFLVQLVFFRLFGINYSSTVAAAGVVNVLASCIVLRMAFQLTGRAWLAVVAGAVTAALFQAPFGTLWFEQTAFFFSLVSLWLVIECIGRERSRVPILGLAGVSLGLAVLCKQNAAVYFLPVIALPLVSLEWPNIPRMFRSIGAYAAGAIAVLLLFVGWVLLFSDFHIFYRHVIQIPSEVGAMRFTNKTLGSMFFSSTREPYRTACLTGMAGLLLSVVVNGVGLIKGAVRPIDFLNAGLAVLLLIGTRLFISTTFNDPENSAGFAGLMVVCGGAGAVAAANTMLRARLAAAVRVCTWAFVVLSGAAGVALGTQWALNRVVQQFHGSVFEQRLSVPGLERVYWGRPTTPGIDAADIENVWRHLISRPGAFFVFPDVTILYGITGRVAPQPFLYFQKDHIFRDADLHWVDETVLAGLKKNGVSTFVLQRPSAHGYHRYLRRLTRTNAWINGNFRLAAQYGIFHVYELRKPSIAGSAGA